MSKRFTISLPDNEYNLLVADAERSCRTLSEEITYMIRLHKGGFDSKFSKATTITTTTK